MSANKRKKIRKATFKARQVARKIEREKRNRKEEAEAA